jgi:hypothetical protein
VDLNVSYSFALSVLPSSGPPSGIITLTGTGFTSGSSANISYLNPINLSWIPIVNNLATPNGELTYQTTAPDLLQNNIPGDGEPLSDIILFKAVDNSNGQVYNSTIPYTEYRRGLTHISTMTAQGIYGNNTNLAPNVLLQTGDTVTLRGRWFTQGPALLMWDEISLGNLIIDESGQFNTTITVPTTSAGQHTLTISDAATIFCVNLTREPMVANDYSDVWHNSDFVITLTPDYAVEETYYRINGGTIYNLTSNGQPIITTSSASNTLEYWATWNPGTGTTENIHKTITGIKLDKNLPIGTITTTQTTTATNVVTLRLSAYDLTSGIVSMRFSNDGLSWTSWEAYATTKTWTLQGNNGQKTVHAQFRDNSGLTSTCYCTITLDIPDPTPVQATTTPTQTPTPSPSEAPTPTPSKMAIQSSTPGPYNIETAGILTRPEIIVLFAVVIGAIVLILLLKRKKQPK